MNIQITHPSQSGLSKAAKQVARAWPFVTGCYSFQDGDPFFFSNFDKFIDKLLNFGCLFADV